MSLDGLRAWIGEVERKLGIRTRVFLALTVLAIGIGGAAIYLAIDARDSSVSEADVQALQEQLEAQIGAGAGGTAGAQVVQLETELKALQAEVAALQSKGGKSQESRNEGGGGSGGSPPEEPATVPPSGATGGAASAAKLQELLEQAKEQPDDAE